QRDVHRRGRVRIHVDLDHLDAVAVRAQHRGEAVDDNLIVVHDRESDGHGPHFRRGGVPLVLTCKGGSDSPNPGNAQLVSTDWEVWFCMVILGVILLIIGLIANLAWLWIIGLILAIVGLVLNFVPVGGTRRRYY